MTASASPAAPLTDVEALVATLKNDFSSLGALIRTLSHSVSCDDKNVSIRAHYLPLRNGKPMAGELVEAIRGYICNFALSRAEIQEVHDQAEVMSPQDRMLAYTRLRDSAADLFIKANKSTKRNGECGELLLYLLIEWVLGAPQIVAKLSLKTNGQMPVHGSDGIHIRYDNQTGSLAFIWGEAKLHQSVDGAIASAIKSVSEALHFDKQKEDISLVKRQFDVSGLPPSAKPIILKYLNPLSSAYAKKIDVSACLIGFDFAAFADLSSVATADVETVFLDKLRLELDRAVGALTSSLSANSISHHTMEVFFFPFDSVERLRVDFQNAIGWNNT